MWTDDDVLVTRWQRWHRRVLALNVDALLRWTLILASISMAVSSAVMGLALGVSLLTTLAHWLGY